MSRVDTSAEPRYVEDDAAYQEGAARFSDQQRRVEIDEHSAQGSDDLEPARSIARALLITFAFIAGFAAGTVLGRIIFGGSP